MLMRLFRPWSFTVCMYPEAFFRIKTEEKILCLTFDDGPNRGSTPALLDILDKHNVKALFFCTGKAAEKHPDLIAAIRNRGHLIGNHGHNHLDGWKTSGKKYSEDVNKAAEFTSDNFFRPPYGHLRMSQYRNLSKTFKIIFWDIMPYDFDAELGAAGSLEILKEKIRPGSIIVLHDSPGSSSGDLIGEFLNFSKTTGYRFVLPL